MTWEEIFCLPCSLLSLWCPKLQRGESRQYSLNGQRMNEYTFSSSASCLSNKTFPGKYYKGKGLETGRSIASIPWASLCVTCGSRNSLPPKPAVAPYCFKKGQLSMSAYSLGEWHSVWVCMHIFTSHTFTECLLYARHSAKKLQRCSSIPVPTRLAVVGVGWAERS